MRRRTLHRIILRAGQLVPFYVLYQSAGCLPDNAIRQVTAENFIFTSAVVVQTLTAIFFNTLFGLI